MALGLTVRVLLFFSADIVEAWKVALDQVLNSWRNTPYVLGSQTKKRGVDCGRFADAVAAELHGLPIVNPPAFIAMDHELAARQVVELMSRYPHQIVRDGEIEAGDFLVVRANGTEGHAMIVGSDGITLWHSTQGAGVCTTGLGAYRDKIIKILRSTARESWTA